MSKYIFRLRPTARQLGEHYELATAPTIIIDPVGAPVGDPPSGSTLTASFPAPIIAADWRSLKVRTNAPLCGKSPRDTCDFPCCGSAHSSNVLCEFATNIASVTTFIWRASTERSIRHCGCVASTPKTAITWVEIGASIFGAIHTATATRTAAVARGRYNLRAKRGLNEACLGEIRSLISGQTCPRGHRGLNCSANGVKRSSQRSRAARAPEFDRQRRSKRSRAAPRSVPTT